MSNFTQAIGAMPRRPSNLRNQSILTGCPVDKVKQLLLGLESVSPPPGSATVPCDRCHELLYLSPHQQESKRYKPGSQCLCMPCLMTRMRESGIEPPFTTFNHGTPIPLAASIAPTF
jgi:hypothetical protein